MFVVSCYFKRSFLIALIWNLKQFLRTKQDHGSQDDHKPKLYSNDLK